MVRQRKSYTVCEISYPDKEGHSSYPILESMIITCLHKAVKENCGEVGLARVTNDCKIIYLNTATNIVIFSSHHGSHKLENAQLIVHS